MKIRTEHVYPPIPSRNFDWAAYDDNACMCEECHPRIGHGPTEEDAIADLLEKCEDFAASVLEGTELLTKLVAEEREKLFEKLREMSVTHEFAESGLSTSLRVGAECENGAADESCDRQLQPLKVLEAERKHYGRQHRLRLEADERWPEEDGE